MPTLTLYPSSASNDNSIGTGAWSNPSRVTAADSSFASWLGGGDTTSNYLKCIFSLVSLPVSTLNETVNIDNIRLYIYRYADSDGTSNYILDQKVQLLVNNSLFGTNIANTSDKWPTIASSALYSFVSLPTEAQAHTGNFGCMIQTYDGVHGADAFIDYVIMEIDYSIEYTGDTFLPPPVSIFKGLTFSKIFQSRIITIEKTDVRPY